MPKPELSNPRGALRCRSTRQPADCDDVGTQLLARELIDELARSVHDPELARTIARRAGFPAERLSEFKTALGYWTSVVEQAVHGAIPLDALIAEAVGYFPYNDVLVALQRAMARFEVGGRIARPPRRGTDWPVRRRARIALTYSHADAGLRNELYKHLMPLERAGLVALWCEHQVPVGAEALVHGWPRIHEADIVLLLVSVDFLASEHCWTHEMKRVLEQHDSGRSIVAPVILRACNWHVAPFAYLRALPEGSVPAVAWRSLDDAFTDVAYHLGVLAAELDWDASP